MHYSDFPLPPIPMPIKLTPVVPPALIKRPERRGVYGARDFHLHRVRTGAGAPPELHLPRYGLFVPDVPQSLSIVRSL